MKNFLGTVILLIGSCFSGCATSRENLTEMLEKHPEILTNAIEKNPDKFMISLQKASRSAQARMQESAARDEDEKMNAEFKSPLSPDLNAKRTFFGNPKAPVTIVEYTDFQCPYCARGFDTLEKVREVYGEKVRVLVKHLPLPMHPLAKPAAQRFEAILMQSPEKAYAFYREIFENQAKLNSGGEKYLDGAVKKVGADPKKVAKDMGSPAVQTIIENDLAEASKFGITGTPAFVINGVSLRGAYPLEMFKKVIDQHLARAAVTP